MNFKGVEIVCPACKGELEWLGSDGSLLGCGCCQQQFPVVCGIPDLRVFPDPYIDAEADRAKGVKIAEQSRSVDFEGLIDFYYGMTEVVPPQHARMYKRGLLAGVSRAEAALNAWEQNWSQKFPDPRPLTPSPHSRLLEIGCGTGPLLVAASRRYQHVVGIDIAFRWLVMGKKRLDEAGLDVPLICACAEALPFRDDSFDCVVADSVIEHTRSQPDALREARRVMGDEGRLFLSTPNRFSIGPDPHTGLPAGSLLPQSITASYVRRQGGIPPERRLLSVMSMTSLLKQSGFERFRLFLPDVPKEQRAMFSSPTRQLVDAYRFARRAPGTRHLLYLIGPLLYAVATPAPVKAARREPAKV